MYRAWPVESIYCEKTRCDRHCGRFHPKFLANTRKRRRISRQSKIAHSASTVSSASSRESSKVTQSVPNLVDSPHSLPTFPEPLIREYPTFEEIMAEASRKVSAGYRSPPLPPYAFGEHRPPVRRPSRGESFRTTTASSNSPQSRAARLDSVWDDDEFRKHLLDSDEEGWVSGEPPKQLDDNDSTIDTIISSSKPDSYSDPLYEGRSQLHSAYVADNESIGDVSLHLGSSRVSLDSLFNEFSLLSTSGVRYEGSLEFAS